MTAEFTLAAVFDLVDPLTGPDFHEDHPVIEDGDEREALVEYLASATTVLMTPSLMDDVLDPERPGGVPMNYRCDGRWIWTDTVTYYLDRYGLAPEPGLLAHLRERTAAGAAPEPPAPDVQERAVAFLLAPPAAGQETVWEVEEGL
ncbi:MULTISPECIES: hypothetical protein [unclassified Kitasatospora]|uniref:hypothetical protein n=1 Tax=unclassified Kitasatospora TaxID=2633591 RepID=UPI0024731003|nr:hypothetical protein [Kitasatospora sp. MAA19]MDH6708734.1 hypothetical protein [Kitasatospora sp. MAA19]